MELSLLNHTLIRKLTFAHFVSVQGRMTSYNNTFNVMTFVQDYETI